MSIVEIVSDTSGAIVGETVVGVWNVYNQIHPYNLEFKRDTQSVAIRYKEEITVELDNVLCNAWWRGGTQSVNIEKIGNNTIRILDENASLQNLIFLPNEVGLLNMQFSFESKKLYPPHHTEPQIKNYAYHVVQIDAVSNKIIGGHTFQVTDFPTYRGSNSDTEIDNEVICSDTSVNTESEIKPNKIVSVQPNPATDQITVAYELNGAENASIFITNYYFTGNSDNYVLDINSQSKTFNIQTYTAGIYVITLICDGIVVDSKTFVKQ